MNKSYTVKITSKNQVTLPSKLMRDFQLYKGSSLTVKKTKHGIELSPEPSLEERMRPIWDEIAKLRAGKPALTDEQLAHAARDAWVDRNVL